MGKVEQARCAVLRSHHSRLPPRSMTPNHMGVCPGGWQIVKWMQQIHQSVLAHRDPAKRQFPACCHSAASKRRLWPQQAPPKSLAVASR
jgi:hypothetical protein